MITQPNNEHFVGSSKKSSCIPLKYLVFNVIVIWMIETTTNTQSEQVFRKLGLIFGTTQKPMDHEDMVEIIFFVSHIC